MENQKLENLLNLALNATPEELEKSENLSVGYETEQGKWEVIVKYSGEPEIFENPEIQTVRLLGGFAILTLSQNPSPHKYSSGRSFDGFQHAC